MRVTTEAIVSALLAADDASAKRLLRDMGHTLLAKPDLAAELVTVALDPADGPECEAASALLASALEEARIADRNEFPEGRVLLDSVAVAVDAALATKATKPGTRLRIAQIYSRAGLPPPTSAILSMSDFLVKPIDHEGDGRDHIDALVGRASDPDTILGNLKLATDGDAYLAYATLAEQLAAFPEDVLAHLVTGIAERDEPFASRISSYFMLHRSGAARVAAAAAIAKRADAGRLDPETSAILVSTRTWLSADPARPHVDAAIRSTMRQASDVKPTSDSWTVERVLTTIPDGSGAQSIAVSIKSGRQRAVFMLLLKQYHGVVDAFVMRCKNAAEREQILRELKDHVDAFEVDASYPREALRRALGESLNIGLLPPSGLIDALRIWPGDVLTPTLVTTEDLCETADVDELEAYDELPKIAAGSLMSWFEDTADLRLALAGTRTDNARETVVAARLENRREWWARQCAITAETFSAARGSRRRAAKFFAASARALLDGEAIEDLTVGQIVFSQTLDADDDRADIVDAFLDETDDDVFFGGKSDDIASWLGASERFADLSETLAAAGISEPFVDGYLAANMLAPVPRHPLDWAVSLVELLPVESPAEAERVLNHILSRLDFFFAEGVSPTALAARLEVATDVEFIAFLEGFSSVTTDRKSWPKQMCDKQDKRVLRTIKKCRRGTDSATIEATKELFTPWLTQLAAERSR